jgi:tetratricopeptide (TPR) repeat protein
MRPLKAVTRWPTTGIVALRLTDTSSAAAVAVPASAPDVALLDRARTALAVGDHDAFRATGAETSDLTDPHRRYVVRRTIVELGLKDARRPQADKAAVLLATAEVALVALDAEPAEPVLLNLAGVVLHALGSLRGAEALMNAAAALDAAVPNLAGNLAGVRKLREGGQTLKPPAAITARVNDLERRAVRTAKRARPASAATISLCMIVRDEEATLARAIESAKGVVDEIVVVDTGSQDRTVQIARELGAGVLEHPWAGDFAAARNVGVEAATSDWILFLDADEALAGDDAAKLRDLARRTWREGFLLTIVNRVGDDRAGIALTQDVLRLFRNRPEHRFEGRIHEGVLHALPADAPERIEAAGVRIDHDGYLDATRAAKDKSRRNLELLERQLRESAPTAYLHFNLGSEHLAGGDPQRAVRELATAWEMLLAEPAPAEATFAPALAARYAAALRAAGRLDESIAVADRGLELFAGFTDLVLEQALAHRAGRDDDRAEERLRRALELGDAPARYAAVTGAGTFLAATALAQLLVERGETAEAVRLLDEALAVNPRHDAARIVLADAHLARSAFAEAAQAAEAVDADSPFAAEAAARATLARAAAGQHAGTVPRDLLPLLTVTLDARLAAVDIDGFVALLPLAERIEGLGARERRELLACLYLERGFLDSAADEWAAACDEHGPDAAALTGLSRVAAARGDADDAAVFAEGARELSGAQSA